MNHFDLNISNFQFIQYGLVTLLLLAILGLFNLFLSKLGHKNVLINYVKRVLPAIQIFIFILYIFWFFLHNLKYNSLYYHFVILFILSILVGLCWSFFRDVVWGVIFKVENSLFSDQILKVGNHRGYIKNLGFRSLYLMEESGNLVKIPYSKISTRTIEEVNQGTIKIGYTFTLSTKYHSQKKLFMKIKEIILSHPYSSINQEPVIKILGIQDTKTDLEITIYPIEGSYSKSMEMSLKEHLLKYDMIQGTEK